MYSISKSSVSDLFCYHCPEPENHSQISIDINLSKSLENLGLSIEQQKKYPEFIEMIKENELVDYMEGINWKIDHEDWEGSRMSFASKDSDEPLLFIDGKSTLWSAAKEKLFGDKPLSWKLSTSKYRIDSSGIRSQSMSEWSTLTPCGKLKNHDGNFYLDVMTTTEGLNHNWVRLIDDKGEVISAGLCGEIYSVAMLRDSVGKLNSPDHREFFKPNTHRSTRIRIDKETYETIKANKIETDQKTHNLFFSLMTRNCSKYTCEVASNAGLDLENSEFPSQLATRKILNAINFNPPTWMLRLFERVTSIFRHTLATGFAFIMGAWYQNPDVKELEDKYGHEWKVKPRKPFRSLKSFFDGTNSLMASSMKVAEWQNFVENYRLKRKAFLQTHKEELVVKEYFKVKDFENNWEKLEKEVMHEMPPKLDSGYLYLNHSHFIPTNDLEKKIADLTKNLSN